MVRGTELGAGREGGVATPPGVGAGPVVGRTREPQSSMSLSCSETGWSLCGAFKALGSSPRPGGDTSQGGPRPHVRSVWTRRTPAGPTPEGTRDDRGPAAPSAASVGRLVFASFSRFCELACHLSQSVCGARRLGAGTGGGAFVVGPRTRCGPSVSGAAWPSQPLEGHGWGGAAPRPDNEGSTSFPSWRRAPASCSLPARRGLRGAGPAASRQRRPCGGGRRVVGHPLWSDPRPPPALAPQ